MSQASPIHGRPSYSESTAVQFNESDNVYVKSTLAVDFTPGRATATLPIYRGLSPQGFNASFNYAQLLINLLEIIQEDC